MQRINRKILRNLKADTEKKKLQERYATFFTRGSKFCKGI